MGPPQHCARAAPGPGGRRATKNGTPTTGTGGPTPEQPVEGTDGQSASVQGDCRGVRRGLRRCRGASGADVTDGRPGWDRTALADGRAPRVGPGGGADGRGAGGRGGAGAAGLSGL